MRSASADRDTGLGGKLLYAGKLDAESRALIVAANIAGAASLTATADRAAQKQAVRDGIADFLVASLDEALRILKNQLRKREPAAVCVAAAPADVEREMCARGVLPDLVSGRAEGFASAKILEDRSDRDSVIVTWSVDSAPAQWLPKLDALAMECLGEDAWQARRWLRLSPRYLGRLAQGFRLLRCDDPSSVRFVQQVHQRVSNREIPVAVVMKARDAAGKEEEWRVEPPWEVRINHRSKE
jgi:Urocanase Rossmann-like domain